MSAADGIAGREVLEFDDLTPYLLLKNGNFLYKVPYRGGWAVLKVYYGSRPLHETVLKSIGNVLFEGQTSYMPLTRRRVELECLRLWRDRGFRVFDVYEHVEVIAPPQQCPPGGYLLLEYVEAPKLREYLVGPAPVDERFATYRRWLLEWCRRHTLAEAEREPRLVHENGDAKHVMLLDDGFLWFDFEMVFRDRDHVHEHVAHEIIQFLWFFLRMLPEELGERLLEETVLGYPDTYRLEFAPRVFLDPPRLLPRWARRLDQLKPKSHKPSSKYNVARRLQAALARQRAGSVRFGAPAR